MNIDILTKLKIRTGEEDTMLLSQILEDAKFDILDYTNRDVLIPRMEGLQRELAIIYYNRLKTEGEASRSEGGVSVSYNNDIPENLKRRLNSFKRLKAVRLANEDKE